MFPGSITENIPLTGTKDNRHFLVGSFIANITFEKAVAYYRPHVAKVPPMKLSTFGSYKTTQGWLKGFKRGQYAFRVNLLSPAMNAEGKPDPKLTRIQYYMETN